MVIRLRHGMRDGMGVSGLFMLLGIGLVAGSQIFTDTMQTEYQTYQRRFTEFSNLYLNVDVDALIIKDHYPRFVALYKRGVIGQEQRLSWIETLESAGQELNLSSVSYQIQSRRPVTPKHSLPTDVFDLYATPMHITLGLFSEGELKRLFDELDARAQGLYTVTHCTMKRIAKRDTGDAEGPRISAECELLWYSIAPRDGRKIGP